MSSTPPVTFTLDGERVGWIVFDDPATRANVFSPAMQAALAAALDTAARSAAIALVMSSAKERIFIAGGDLRWLQSVPDVRTAEEFSRNGQQLFQRLAEFPAPCVCAIHGACAGGGFELALACHWRIATDEPVTQIGLPETSLGTIPGWGGCVRLPRLIGVEPALDHILKGKLVGPGEAARIGLVNEVVPSGELKTRARTIALELAAGGRPPLPHVVAPEPGYYAKVRAATRARTSGHLPAPEAAIDAVEQTANLPVAEALEIEARLFGAVTAGDVFKNMIHIFFLREAARKRTLEGWFEERFRGGDSRRHPVPAGSHPGGIRRIGVVGAGVMGSGIAHWLAAHGFEVIVRDVDPALVERGFAVVRRLFDEAVKRGRLTGGEANAGLRRITSTSGWEGFDACDLVIEAIIETSAAKKALFSELAAIVGPDALLASNTSALPLEEIAGHVPRPERTLGIHFFNPVSRMPLVELIIARETSPAAAGRALALVKALGKMPVICRSSPGFLVTRVLFFYLNEAVRLWEQGLPTLAIDSALRDFGWPMGPLRLVDEVGIDVCGFIFGELEHYFPGRFSRSSACGRLHAAGLEGRKNGAGTGFYRYLPAESLNDTITRQVAGRLGELTMDAEEIAGRLMRVMAGEAQRCLEEGVVRSPDDVDFALTSGAGFPAFRGGLMRWARTAGLAGNT
jgi:3-hydroxyacyl-CoA dehydrogenase / enoyl-CoA hydratase / 3-hydroxybutyryl-CoA epimerase